MNKRRYQKWLATLAHEQNHVCALCDLPLNSMEAEVDHIVPRGAYAILDLHPDVTEILDYDPANLQAVHPVCNRTKGAKPPAYLPIALTTAIRHADPEPRSVLDGALGLIFSVLAPFPSYAEHEARHAPYAAARRAELRHAARIRHLRRLEAA